MPAHRPFCGEQSHTTKRGSYVQVLAEYRDHRWTIAALSSLVSLALSVLLVSTTVQPACHSLANQHRAGGLRSGDSHNGHTGGSVQSYPRPDALPLSACRCGERCCLITRQARRSDTPACRELFRYSAYDVRGWLVSPWGFRQDQLVQRQVGDRPTKPFVLLLKAFQFFELIW